MVMKDKRSLLLIGLYTVIILVAGFAGYRTWAVNNVMAGMYDTSLGQFQGAEDAEKVIVEILDYRCSYCRAVHETTQELLSRHPDVKIVYRHYPIFGRPSVIEAEVALAAGMQGKFSEAHDALMSRESPITDREIEALVQSIGLDPERFRADMKGPETGYLLLNTLDSVEVLGIKSTPVFIIGDIVYSLDNGMPTVETFEQFLEEAYGD